MSPVQQKPILHGRDHCPGGADPIPCMISGPSGSYETVVLETSDLLAYWRLGETGSPWEDTSGVGPGPADLTEYGSGAALSPDVTGALQPGSDDGALEFNYDGVALSGGRAARHSGTKDFDFTDTLGEMTAAVWVNVKASALTRRGLILGNSSSSVTGPPDYLLGWGLQVIYPSQKIRFSRGQPGGVGNPELYAETAAGVIAGDWYFVAGTYDTATISLYVNGVLVDTIADTSDAWATDQIFVGLGFTGPATSTDSAYLYGTADEAAVWTRALTAAEIASLYAAGVEGASGGGQVLLSDGAGGTYWGQAGGDAIADEAIVDRHVADGADIDPLKLEHPGGTSTFLRADGTWAAAGGGDPADDTLVWMPLADSDGTLVLDGDDAVIPTLIPI